MCPLFIKMRWNTETPRNPISSKRIIIFFEGFILPTLELINFQNFFFRFVHLPGNGLFQNTASQMFFKKLVLKIRKPLFHSRRLSDHVYAVGLVFEHFLQATNLAFDYFQTSDELVSGIGMLMHFHNNKIYPPGGIVKWKTILERVTGIEPVSQPWEGRVLPLYDTRVYENIILVFNQ